MADSIRVSADLLLTVINDILDFSKMEADKMKVNTDDLQFLRENKYGLTLDILALHHCLQSRGNGA